MPMSEAAALKYAVSKADTWTYPRQRVYDLVRIGAKISEKDFSSSTVDATRDLAKRIGRRRGSPASRVLLRDVNEVLKELEGVEPSYDPNYLHTIVDDVIGFLEKELDAKAPLRMKLSIIERYPHPYEDATAAAWTLGEFESRLTGLPIGVHLRRDQLFPVAAECIMAHEYGHSVIVDLPNYVPWFDEGLADILGYAYYVKRCGKFADLRVWANYRREMKQYGLWYAEYDRLVVTLMLTCGFDFVKEAVKIKRNDPLNIDWTRLAKLLRSNPAYEPVKLCMKAPAPPDRSVPEYYRDILMLLCGADSVYALTSDAFLVMLNLPEHGKESSESAAFAGVPSARRKEAEKELFNHNLIVRHGRRIGVFSGPVLGSKELFRGNLVRAAISPREVSELLRA